MPMAISNPAVGHQREELSSQMVEFLSRPQTYADCPRQVQCIETPVSWVFLTERTAYKWKKPVVRQTLDSASPGQRERACRMEFELNRRMAPNVYLAVVPVTRHRLGYWQLGGEGPPVDWLVKMRRLPAERSLERLLRTGTLRPEDTRQLAIHLAELYQQLPPSTVQTAAYRQGFEASVRATFRELLAPQHGLAEGLVRRVHAAQLRLVLMYPEVLENRAADGRVVEGHGDLRPEHIYLTATPAILDCLATDAAQRQLDVVDELCLLAMECDRWDCGVAGLQILSRYCRASGDRPPTALLAFYKSRWACARARAIALLGEQASRTIWRDRRTTVEDYLKLAETYSQDLGEPLLLVMRGLSGTGKSTLAAVVAKALSCELLQTDTIRRTLRHAGRIHEAGASDRAVSESPNAVYQELFRRAALLLADGLSVVLDATFLTTELLRRAADVAAARGSLAVVLDCQCPTAVAVERIGRRKLAGAAAFETAPEAYQRQRQRQEATPRTLSICPVDTTASPPSMLATVLRHLRMKTVSHAPALAPFQPVG